MRKLFFLLFSGAFLMAACNNNTETSGEAGHNHDTTATVEKADPYKDVVFDNPKDVVCGMPISAGVSDTAHYNSKVYGFCAKECKDEFLKDPESYLAAAK